MGTRGINVHPLTFTRVDYFSSTTPWVALLLSFTKESTESKLLNGQIQCSGFVIFPSNLGLALVGLTELDDAPYDQTGFMTLRLLRQSQLESWCIFDDLAASLDFTLNVAPDL